MHNFSDNNTKSDYDDVFMQIADYVLSNEVGSDETFNTARLCLMDTIGCGMLALTYPACTKLLGPIVPGAILSGGSRVPGTNYELDPVTAAFNIGAMIRWLDFNDTWLAAEWGHPSDNLGAILAVADYLSRLNEKEGKPGFNMREILIAMIKAHEIQGVLALENSFNRVGLDHVILVKLASAAVVANWLGQGDRDIILRTLSHVFVDGQALRTYRHAPNTGSRKSWAAGDATARAVQLALFVKAGEGGYPSALTAPTWGFYDVSFKGQSFQFQRHLSHYVMDHILFKLSYPAEFHAQTAVEAAVILHPKVKNRIDEVERIEIATHESAIRIISKQGPLHNPADRDHCLQYMVAIGLMHGNLTAADYEDNIATQHEVDTLREKMQVFENRQFSEDYHAPTLRSIANRLQVFFKDGTSTPCITVEYPIGHKNRRNEGVPILLNKFKNNLLTQFDSKKVDDMMSIMGNQRSFEQMKVVDFMAMLQKDPGENHV